MGGHISDEIFDEVRRRRMVYRSKQRGWLEVDILLGTWAAQYIPTLTSEELDQYDIILQEETVNIYNYLTGKQELPDHLLALPLMTRIKKYALKNTIKTHTDYAIYKVSANLT